MEEDSKKDDEVVEKLEEENEKTEESKLKAKILKLEDENADLQDKYLRKHAEFDNYRKRMVKEKGEAIAFANAELMREMLEVLDNFERAEKAALENNDIDAIKQGIEMVNNSLLDTLTKRGLTKIKSVGEEFNPDVHLAINFDEGDVDYDTVSEEYLPGYTLNDRVLRPATVRVTKVKKTSE